MWPIKGPPKAKAMPTRLAPKPKSSGSSDAAASSDWFKSFLEPKSPDDPPPGWVPSDTGGGKSDEVKSDEVGGKSDEVKSDEVGKGQGKSDEVDFQIPESATIRSSAEGAFN